MTSILVSQLYIYPVKSLGGIELDSCDVLPKGLAGDRRWMLVDESNRFLTQRTLPDLSQFRLSLATGCNGYTVSFGNESIMLPGIMEGPSLEATIWDDKVMVTEPDSLLSAWFSQQLGFRCRLVAFPEPNARPVDPDYALSAHNHTSLSDGYPVLIIGQGSLDALNAQLPEPVAINRFRPNIVCEGSLPHAEDNWKRFSVGSVAMAGVKPCARCVMTTIDQQTGVMGKEPLATLHTYRKRGNKVLFGQNVIPLSSGSIRVGDEIVVSG